MSVSPWQPLQKNHTRCPSCGLGVKTGFPFKRHRAACGPRPEVRPKPPPQYDDDADEYHDDDVASDTASDSSTTPTGRVCPPDAPIVAHFDALQDAPGLNQCFGWGPRVLTPQEQETFRFLQVVDLGSGASSRVAQAMLSYARRLGGNGLLLPRTIQACWTKLHKVTSPFEI